MTRDGLTQTPVTDVALCIVDHKLTYAPVAVRWFESTSGPGTTLYACPEHAPELTPGPLWDELPLNR